jgi:hypothetical protein
MQPGGIVMQQQPATVEVEIEGRKYRGWYSVEKGMVMVSTANYGRKTRQVGGSPPEVLARTMLIELVNEAKRIH